MLATNKRKRLRKTFKPRLPGTDSDRESAVALKRRDRCNWFCEIETEKRPNARVGPADGGGLLEQRSRNNVYHEVVMYPNYRMSRRGQIVIGVEIVEKRQLKSELNAEKTALNAEKTALVGLRCWDVHEAYN
jgi:hypothetical protein